MKFEDLKTIDKQKMYATYDNWPEIAKESFERDIQKCEIKDVDHIVFAGMGGSGSIGDSISAILSKKKYSCDKYQRIFTSKNRR